MLRWVYSIIPDEWISGWRSYRQLQAVASSTARAKAKNCVATLVPFCVGLILSYWFGHGISVDFIQGYLPLLGVLFGFVATLMLFTGSAEGSDVLNHEQANWYAEKVRYLLASQAITLAVYLIAILAGGWWLFLNKSGAPGTHYFKVAPIVFGTGTLALVRTALLPMQIYEKHDFVMTALVDRKQKEFAEAIKKKREELSASVHSR